MRAEQSALIKYMANVTNIKFARINTNIGPLYYSIVYIDAPLVVGQGILINDDIEWYPFLNPSSVFASYNVYSEFESNGGALKGGFIKNGVHALEIYDNGKVLKSVNIETENNKCRILYYIIIGNNNIAFLPGPVTNNRNITDVVKYGANTISSFGFFSDSNTKGYYYGEVTQNGIDCANAILKDTTFGPVNPYDPIEPSEPGGGGGTFDDTSDQIPDSTKPSLSSANTGFTRIYNPTLSQVQSLAQYLWTDASVIETIWNHIKQYFEDPMQAIIGFNLVPVPVPDGGTQEFKLMYIGTGVNMTVAASQFVDVDCGTYTVEKYYGSALDYSPYTKISCFLPFIGNVDLNPDEVMGATLQVTYRVDICSGSCVAKILVDGNCLYQYSGHCAIPIPLASADFSSYVSAAVSVAKLAIGAAVAGAAGAAAGAAMEAGQATGQIVETTQIVNTARNPQSGRQITTGTQTVTVSRPQPEPRNQTQASFAGLSPANVANTVGEVMSSKPIFQHSGSFSGNTGYLGVRRPYLIITRPNLCMPANFQKLNGYPCMMTLKLGDCTGYTRVQQVQLTGLWATNPEQAEILQLLKSGVIL